MLFPAENSLPRCPSISRGKNILSRQQQNSRELKQAVANKVGRIVVDNIFELEALNAIAADAQTTVDILLRN